MHYEIACSVYISSFTSLRYKVPRLQSHLIQLVIYNGITMHVRYILILWHKSSSLYIII